MKCGATPGPWTEWRGSPDSAPAIICGICWCTAWSLTRNDPRQVERRIAIHPLSQTLDELLDMARELRDSLPVRDRFRREAAANYVLRGPLGWLGFSRFWTSAFVSALFAQLGGPA